MRHRNIVFCVRRNYLDEPGGDTDQMFTWCEVLRKLDNRVTILSGGISEEDIRDADAVFVWHLERPHESYQPWLTAKKLRKAIFFVPTCWHPAGERSGLRPLLEQLAQWFRGIVRFRDRASRLMLRHSWKRARAEMLRKSSMHIVNSLSEKEFLVAEGAPPERIVCVPNVIRRAEIAAAERRPWEERRGIVCVGHFCPRKNQLALIRALAKTDVEVTFAGRARPMHHLYYLFCRWRGGGKHRFLGSIPHDRVLELLGRSRLCISISRSETPGISNLEAGALGCALLLPKLAPVEEYFGGHAVYFDPAKFDPAQLVRAASAEPSPAVREMIMEKYTESVVERFFDRLQLPEEDV